MWEMVASTGVAFQLADLSRGLSAAEVRRRAARWRLVAVAGCAGVGVSNGGVFGCREPLGRHWLRGSLLGL